MAAPARRACRTLLFRSLALLLFLIPASMVLPIQPALAAGGEDAGGHFYAANGNGSDAIGSAHATWNGNSQYTAGASGQAGDTAFLLDGASDLTADPEHHRFRESDFAIHALVKVDQLGGYQWIVSKRQVCAGTNFFEVGFSGASALFSVDDGQGNYAQAAVDATGIDDGQFHEVTARRSGKNISLRVDDRPTGFASSPGVANVSTWTPMSIGKQSCNGGEHLRGAIDALTVSAVDQHLITGNGTTEDSFSPAALSWSGSEQYTPAPAGSALSFAWGGSEVVFADSSVGLFGTQDFLISFNLRFLAGGGNGMALLSKRAGCGGGSFFDLRGNSLGVGLELYDDWGAGTSINYGFPDLADGAFHHFKVTRVGTSLTIQVDDLPGQTQSTGSVVDLTGWGAPWRIAGSPCIWQDSTIPFGGDLYDVTLATISPLTVTAPTLSLREGDAIPVLVPRVEGLTRPLTASPICTTTATAGSPVGSYPVTCSFTDPTYAVTTVPGAIHITSPALSIAGTETTVTYGSPIANSFTPVYTGLVDGATQPAVEGSCTTTATTASPVGDYPITCSGFDDPVHTISYAPATLHITPAASVTVVAPARVLTYGEAVPSLVPSYMGLVSGQSAPSTPATCSTTAVRGSAPGSYPVTCSGAADSNYAGFAYQQASITVVPAWLTVTAPSPTVVYGDPVPSTFAPAIAGLVNGDGSLATTGSCTTTAVTGSPAGSYPITCSGFADPRYDVQTTPGTLSIAPSGTVTVTGPSVALQYGDAIPALPPTYGGLAGSDTATQTPATCSTAATGSSPVGSYPVVCSGASDDNYSGITYVPGAITIVAAPLTVTAPNHTEVYGDTVPASFRPSFSGLVNGDTAPAGSTSCTSTGQTGSDAGSYPISCTASGDPNYDVTYAGGTLVITAAPAVTVTAPTTSVVYGSALPSLAPSYTGLVSGDTTTTTPASCSTTATPASPAGSYPISCTGAADANYTSVVFVPGALTVTPAALTVAATSATSTYGAGLPSSFAPLYTGLVNGDSSPVVRGSCTTTATGGSVPGTYPIACSGFSDPSYSITYEPGALTVDPAPLRITASGVATTYGDLVPASFAAGYTGLVNGDLEPAQLGTCTTSAVMGSVPGSYPITCSGFSDSRYVIDYLPGALRVDQRALTVAAPSATITQGDLIPGFTPTYTGLVNGDTEPTAVGSCGTTAVSSSLLGDYPVTCSGYVDPRYAISYTAGVLTVRAPPLVLPTPGPPTLGPVPTVAPSPVLPPVPVPTSGVAPTPDPTPSATPSPSPSPSPTASPTAEAEPAVSPSVEPQPVVDPASGDRPELEPGASFALLNGKQTAATVTVVKTQVHVTSGPVQLSVSSHGTDGSTHSPSGDATLTLDRGGMVTLSGTGYTPGSSVVVWMFSTPVRLGTAPAGPDGSIQATFRVPMAVEGGHHTIQVNGSSADGERSVSLGVVVDPSGVPVWLAADNPEVVIATQVAFLALAGMTALGGLSAVGGVTALGGAGGLAGGLAGGAPGGPAGPAGGKPSGGGGGDGGAEEGRRRKGGKLAGAKVSKLAAAGTNLGRGDRSLTWRLPGSTAADRLGRLIPERIGAVSPLLARLVSDGSHLRAILGVLWLLLLGCSVVTGVLAALTADIIPAPAVTLACIALALGILDALAGMLAGSAFLLTLVATGGLNSTDDIRGAMGVAALWFALPLIAVELRPFRRTLGRTASDVWYRAGDYVVLPLLGWWLTFKLVKALSGLYGHAVPLAEGAEQLALVAALAILARLLIEDVAAGLYPARLSDVLPKKLPSPPTSQKLLAVATKVSLFVFVSVPFVGWRPELFIGAALFALPQVLKIWDAKLPNFPKLHRVVPAGLVKLTGLVVAGLLISDMLKSRIDDPAKMAATGFVVLAIPATVQGLLGLIAREGPKPQQTWAHRAVGAVLVIIAGAALYTLTVAT